MSGDLHCFRCCSGCLIGHGKAVWGGRGGGWWHMATWTMGAGGMQAGSPGRVWAYLLVVEQDAVECWRSVSVYSRDGRVTQVDSCTVLHNACFGAS